jgi:hypothetical protein
MTETKLEIALQGAELPEALSGDPIPASSPHLVPRP